MLKFILNFFKNKNYYFSDKTKILFTGRGGLAYVNKYGDSIFLEWQHNKDYDIIIECEDLHFYSRNEKIAKNEKIAIVKKIKFYCEKFNIKYKIYE